MTIKNIEKPYIFQKFIPNTTTTIEVQVPVMDKWFDVTVPMHIIDLTVAALGSVNELDVDNVFNKIIEWFHINFISNLPSEHHASVSACIREALVEACIENMIEESIDKMANDILDVILSADSLIH